MPNSNYKKLKDFVNRHQKTKIVIGIICIILGFLALVTPFTPGSWLIFVGLEILGFNFVLWKKLKKYLYKK